MDATEIHGGDRGTWRELGGGRFPLEDRPGVRASAGRSGVSDPAMTGAAATTGDGWSGLWISTLFSGNNFRTMMDSNSLGWGQVYISTLQRSHRDGGFGCLCESSTQETDFPGIFMHY